MKKVLLFLCALVAAQMANAWYLTGSVTSKGWGTGETAIEANETIGNLQFCRNLNLIKDGEFKFLADKNTWDNAIGGGNNINAYYTYSVNGGSNSKFVGESGTYTMVLDQNEKKLLIYKENAFVEGFSTNEQAVYFVDDKNWSNIHVYSWGAHVNGAAGWPGSLMTSETTYEGKNVYKYAFSYTPDMLVFNGGGDSKKTGDLVYVRGGVYASDGKLLGLAKYEETIGYGMYYLKPGAWDVANIWYAAYFFNKNDDSKKTWVYGHRVENEGEVAVYFGLEDRVNTYTNVVFCQMKNEAPVFNEETGELVNVEDAKAKMKWENKNAQTEDLFYVIPENNCITVFVIKNVNGEGEWVTIDLSQEVPTALDRVELAGGIGYAYGVVSAEGAIEVYNVNGAVVARGNDTIDLRGLGRGVYIIRNGNQVRKVVR